MRKQFPECPNRSCQVDITASNDLRSMPKYLKEAHAHKAIPGFNPADGCEYCVHESVVEVAELWLKEGALEDVSRMLAEYIGLPVPA